MVSKLKKVLVVDDDQEDLAVMKKILIKNGYSPVTCSDADEALKNLVGDGFVMLLIDIKLPVLSGYDLLRLMRERVNHFIPLLFVSVVPKDEVDLKDVDGFIQKPFSEEDFIKEVKSAISKFKPKDGKK